jgi:hypothetical protein
MPAAQFWHRGRQWLLPRLGVAAHKLSFDACRPAGSRTPAPASPCSVFIGDFLINGSTKRSNTIERQYLDHSPVTYEYMRGMTLNTLQVEAKQQAIATYTKTYIGRDAFLPSPMVRLSGATDVAAPTYGVLNTSSNVGRIGFDGSTITGPNFVMSAQFTVNNNIRAQKAIGSIGASAPATASSRSPASSRPISAIPRSIRRSSTTR